MDILLEDYDELEDFVPLNAQICDNKSPDEKFPELWEVEMEVLQVENSFNTSVNIGQSFISHKKETVLEDYVDSEDEDANDLAPEECNIHSDDHEHAFPTMWELELEILNSNQSTLQDPSDEKLENADFSESEMSDSHLYSAALCASPTSKTRFRGNEDVREAKYMLDRLNISNGEEIEQQLKGDVQNIFANLNIA